MYFVYRTSIYIILFYGIINRRFNEVTFKEFY